MKKIIYLGCSVLVGLILSISTQANDQASDEVCYYAQKNGSTGYYRCERGGGCTYIDNKDADNVEQSGNCNPIIQ